MIGLTTEQVKKQREERMKKIKNNIFSSSLTTEETESANVDISVVKSKGKKIIAKTTSIALNNNNTLATTKTIESNDNFFVYGVNKIINFGSSFFNNLINKDNKVAGAVVGLCFIANLLNTGKFIEYKNINQYIIDAFCKSLLCGVSILLAQSLALSFFNNFFSIDSLLLRTEAFIYRVFSIKRGRTTFGLLSFITYILISIASSLTALPITNKYFNTIDKELSIYILMMNSVAIFVGLLQARRIHNCNKNKNNTLLININEKAKSFYNSLSRIIIPVASLGFTFFLLAGMLFCSTEDCLALDVTKEFFIVSSTVVFPSIILIAIPAYLEIRSLIVEISHNEGSMLNKFAVLQCITAMVASTSFMFIYFIFSQDVSAARRRSVILVNLYILAVRMLIGYFTKFADISADRAEKTYGEDSVIANKLNYYDSMGDVVGDTLGYYLTITQISLLFIKDNNILSLIMKDKDVFNILSRFISKDNTIAMLFAMFAYKITKLISILFVVGLIMDIFVNRLINKFASSATAIFFSKRFIFAYIEAIVCSIVYLIIERGCRNETALQFIQTTLSMATISFMPIFVFALPYFINISDKRKSRFVNNVLSTSLCVAFGIMIPTLSVSLLSDFGPEKLISTDTFDISTPTLFTLIDSATSDLSGDCKEELEKLDVIGNSLAGVTKIRLALAVICNNNMFSNIKDIVLPNTFTLCAFIGILMTFSIYLGFSSIKHSENCEESFESAYKCIGVSMLLSIILLSKYFLTDAKSASVVCSNWYIAIFFLSAMLFTLGATFDNVKKCRRVEYKKNPSEFNLSQLHYAIQQDLLGDVIKDYFAPAMTCFAICVAFL